MDSIFIVFLAFSTHLVLAQSECPSFYKRSKEVHTFCKPPKTSCNIVAFGVNDTQIKEIVRVHNEFRSKIANGQETVVQLPPAADMLQMEWDTELAAVAQKHTEQCEFKHDCGECRAVESYPDVGQNVFIRSYEEGYKDADVDWSSVVTAWYSEVKDSSLSDIRSFGESDAKIGHFAEVIWSKTCKVGCGFAAYKKEDGWTEELCTCNYAPSGNLLGGIIYEEGEACSKCPNNTACNDQQTEYPGLCHVNSL